MEAPLPGPLHRLMADRRLQEDIVEESGLDWLLIRPPRLTNGRRTGAYRIGTDAKLGSFAGISRADVADFMVQQVESGALYQVGVTISY